MSEKPSYAENITLRFARGCAEAEKKELEERKAQKGGNVMLDWGLEHLEMVIKYCNERLGDAGTP